MATLLNWSSLIFVLIFSAIFLKEKMKRRSLAWVAVAVVGLALLVVPKMEGYRLAPFAVAVGILGAIFSAMSMTAVRAASTRFSPELIIFYFSFLAAVLSLPVAFSESGLGDVVGVIFSSPTRISLVLALGISGSVAQYAMTRGYSLVSAGIGGSMSLLTAAFSALIGWWFFDERLAWVQWVGVFLLATGVVLAGASGAFERRSRAGTLAQTPEIS
ncbi:DMT family transporter [bacterium]|nr:DMT family transporter [bacterium]